MSIVVRDERLARRLVRPQGDPGGTGDGGLDGSARAARSGSALLRWSLRAADALALATAWTLTTLVWPTQPSAVPDRLLLGLLPFVGAGCWLIAKQRLYLARVATMRTVEQAGLVRACILLMAGAAALTGVRGLDVLPARIAVQGMLAFLCLSVARTSYRGWLTAARRNGRFTRPVLIVGVDEQTTEICDVMADHPELGFEPVGVIGDRDEAERAELGHLWVGELEDLMTVVDTGTVTGAIVSSTAVDAATLNDVTRTLLDRRCHVHLSTGITGIDQRRIQPVHLGYEPLLYLEPLALTRGQLLAKRVLDVVISATVAVLVAPVVAVSALAIKVQDRGPVLFRQRRVGRDGELFTILKLRTMAVGAEEHLDELLPYNERNGPLFKMEDDPRVTRVGRLLRSLSIDELPQLWNVLRGDMSLVGPRPALPSEARCFGERLRTRTQVMPGVTGLWQVEARTSGSMHTYERLDLFYIENWSVGLDVMVIIATLEEELVKFVRRLLPSERGRANHPSAAALPASGGASVGEGLPGQV
jgi:exopolysaccharide biosynthesis polyprenyl glycosylphosphotransferase